MSKRGGSKTSRVTTEDNVRQVIKQLDERIQRLKNTKDWYRKEQFVSGIEWARGVIIATLEFEEQCKE